MVSLQTLSDADRRLVAAWAADCADRVLSLFEAEAPDDPRPRDAIARTRAYAAGEVDAASQIRIRFVAGRAAASASSAAGAAAARSAAQASGVAHMGAHALGAAAYAANAVALAAPADPAAFDRELHRQLTEMDGPVREALRLLPALGIDPAGPLGSGLLTRGALGAAIQSLQRDLHA